MSLSKNVLPQLFLYCVNGTCTKRCFEGEVQYCTSTSTVLRTVPVQVHDTGRALSGTRTGVKVRGAGTGTVLVPVTLDEIFFFTTGSTTGTSSTLASVQVQLQYSYHKHQNIRIFYRFYCT
jgi:hypothetical protein